MNFVDDNFHAEIWNLLPIFQIHISDDRGMPPFGMGNIDIYVVRVLYFDQPKNPKGEGGWFNPSVPGP